MTTEKLTFQNVLQWSEEQCRDFLASMRWPTGIRCPKCGSTEQPYTINRKSATKNKVSSLYKCRTCRKQFSATVGTIFEDSKIPLNKWLAALFLMCSSKKGISAHQLYRMLDLGSYETAWFMAHRIREAMRAKGKLTPFSGDVEADETYIHPRRRRGSRAYHERMQDEVQMGIRSPSSYRHRRKDDNPIVFGMQERGGDVRTVVVPEATRKVLHPIIKQWIDSLNARVITDSHPAYRRLGQLVRHDSINHELEFVQGDIHTQNIENFWSIFKRGIYGVFHHIGEDYLPCYLSEFEFKRNRRKVSDAQRFVLLMKQTQGRLTWYCRTAQPENPFA